MIKTVYEIKLLWQELVELRALFKDYNDYLLISTLTIKGFMKELLEIPISETKLKEALNSKADYVLFREV